MHGRENTRSIRSRCASCCALRARSPSWATRSASRRTMDRAKAWGPDRRRRAAEASTIARVSPPAALKGSNATQRPPSSHKACSQRAKANSAAPSQPTKIGRRCRMKGDRRRGKFYPMRGNAPRAPDRYLSSSRRSRRSPCTSWAPYTCVAPPCFSTRNISGFSSSSSTVALCTVTKS